jgi:hypothetical protein
LKARKTLKSSGRALEDFSAPGEIFDGGNLEIAVAQRIN